jgi:hypothetical protein
MHFLKILFIYCFLAILSIWVTVQVFIMCRFRKKESALLNEIVNDIKEIKKKLELLKEE